MPLQLVSVHIDAAEEVGAAVHVEHDAAPLICCLLAREVVGAHLYPFCPQLAPGTSPLPPCFAADLVDALGTELRLDGCGGFGDLRQGDDDFIRLDPCWIGDFLGGEALELFDGVVGGVEEELPDQGEAFIIGDVGGWFEGPGLALFAVEVLGGGQHCTCGCELGSVGVHEIIG